MTKREAHIEALLVSSTLIDRVTDQDSDQFEDKIVSAMRKIASSLLERAENLKSNKQRKKDRSKFNDNQN